MTRPWPEASGISRLYDHGAPWCINASGHPDTNGGYPNADVHVPHAECRSRSFYVDCMSEAGLSTLELYLARPFRFGEERAEIRGTDTPSVVLSSWGSDSGSQPHELRLTPGDALLLARHLVSMVDGLNAHWSNQVGRTSI